MSRLSLLRATAAGGVALVGLLAAPGLGAVPAEGSAATMPVPVDRQDYVTAVTQHNPSDNSVVDPYDADPSSIHVGINGGKEFARSFVHVALDYLPDGSTATKVVMTLHETQQSDASNTGVYPAYNVNNTAALVEACALTTELPAKFDDTKPPAYDCEHGSAVGKRAGNGTWTFDLTPLLPYWAGHGNTGAALVPIGSGDPSQTWSVAFYKSRSASLAGFTQAATPAGSGSGTGSSTGSVGGSASGGPASGGSVTTPPVSGGATLPPTGTVAPPAVPPAVAGSQPATTGPQSTAPASDDGSTPAWPWVLLASIAVAGGALAWPHRVAVLGKVGQLAALYRTHPRAHTVAAAAAAWGLVFTGYSVVNAPAHHGSQLAGASTTPTSVGNGATAPTVTGQPGTTTLTPGATAPGAGTVTGQVTGGALPGASSNPSIQAAQTEFQGPGSFKVINGVRVFFPADGGVPVAQLYKGADDVVGMGAKQIEICAHAALTYGDAFHINASDLDVFWKYNADHGGIWGRTVHGDYTNDNYDPGTAVTAAQSCKDKNTFVLLGGIGFDQIPAVRQWAEQNHELYIHHIATIEGSQGLRYSYSALPTVEQFGAEFGEVAARQFAGKKVGIIYRASSNWTPGIDAFKKYAAAAGITIVGSFGTQINQANYTSELTQLHSAGADVVLAWENALAEIEMIKQAQGQNWHPAWLVNGFNIITNTLGDTALDQDMWGAAAWDAYDPSYYGGGFSSYAAEIKEFEAEYKKYDPGADLTGDGGDLLFLNWEAQRWLADLLTACGKDCTRNKLAGLMLSGYHKTTPPNCPADFNHTDDHHHAGYLFNVLHAVRDPNGRANFVPVVRCVASY